MADKTMPPNDPMVPADPGVAEGDMAVAAESSMPTDGGSVMVSMPKQAFDAMHSLVGELAKGLDMLAQAVNQQASGTEMPPADAMPPEMPPTGGDEEFLNSMAQEGSIR
jgi:hypothetical protein